MNILEFIVRMNLERILRLCIIFCCCAFTEREFKQGEAIFLNPSVVSWHEILSLSLQEEVVSETRHVFSYNSPYRVNHSA